MYAYNSGAGSCLTKERLKLKLMHCSCLTKEGLKLMHACSEPRDHDL